MRLGYKEGTVYVFQTWEYKGVQKTVNSKKRMDPQGAKNFNVQ